MATEHVLISAHRGGAETQTTGGIEAYVNALAIGADYIEFDVHRTSDGELVVYHDKRAEKRGVDPGRLTRADLCREIGHEVLGASDVLGAISGRARAHVDVKAPGYEEAITATALEVLAPEDFVVTGVDAVVKSIKDRFPQVRCALSLGRGWHEMRWSRMVGTRWSELRPASRVRACRADAAAMHHVLARFGALAACARESIDVMVWTVNNPARMRSLLRDPRVSILVTDRPRLALALRDEHRRTVR